MTREDALSLVVTAAGNWLEMVSCDDGVSAEQRKERQETKAAYEALKSGAGVPALNDRELSIVLASLRLWQHEHGHGIPDEIFNIAGGDNAMSEGEIDALCERLNFEPEEGDKRTCEGCGLEQHKAYLTQLPGGEWMCRECSPARSKTPVRNFLDLSTGHLGAESRAYLESPIWPTVYELEFGWLVHVPEGDLSAQAEEQETKIPIALMSSLVRAQSLGCSYIMFDSDAGADEALQWYDDDESEIIAAEV